MGNSFAAASAGSRKTSGSFSRRLIKHFSFRSSGKSKVKATATNGGSSPLGNWIIVLCPAVDGVKGSYCEKDIHLQRKDFKQAEYTPGGL